jgi:large subunit ribosomal protein L15
MNLNQLADNLGARKARKRVGRGIGSGKGGTCGRGTKGQNSRSGVRLKGFEGGQMPLHRRLPKRGFHNPFRRRYQALNLGRLQTAIDAGKIDPKTAITAQRLVDAGVIRRARDGIRLLAKGKITSKVTVEAAGASRTAIAAVEKAGGKVVIAAPKPTAGAQAGGKAKVAAPKAEAGAEGVGKAETTAAKPEPGAEGDDS